MTKKVRFIPSEACSLQVREGEQGQESRRVVGSPIVFGVRSRNLVPWSTRMEVYEILEPGCISDELLRESDVVLNLNHSNKVTDILGRCNQGKGTLTLRKDAKKVESECELPRTSAANDTLELIKRGDITGMSFAFEDDWEDSENGVSMERVEERNAEGKEVWLRHVKRITGLYDVSIVTTPAYPQTSVASREESEAIEAEIEKQIRACGGGSSDDDDEKKKAEEEKAKREAEEQAKREAEEKAKREAEELAAQEQRERERMATEQRQRQLQRMKVDSLFD